MAIRLRVLRKWGASLVLSAALMAIPGCQPGADTESAKFAKLEGEVLQQCKESVQKGESTVFRANALALMSEIRLRGYNRKTPPMVIGAVIGKNPRGEGEILVCDAIAPAKKRDRAVLLYVDSKVRSVQLLFPLETADYPGYASGFVCWVRHVSGDELAGLGAYHEDGTIHVDEDAYDKKYPEFKNVAPVPDGDVAVGLRYPDGTYTNFVPLVRSVGK